MTGLTLQLGQASGRFSLSPGQAFHDYLADLSHGDDAVGFTEVPQHRDELRAACREQGYLPVFAAKGHGDTAIALREPHRILAHGLQDSLRGEKGKGGHTPRPIQWLAFKPASTVETVTLHVAHWLTRKSDDGGQRTQLTDDMAASVKGHSVGARLGFWMGDTNNPDQAEQVSAVDRHLDRGELTSCWDELGRYPDTHGHNTIDVVGSYDPDKRVHCLRARTWHRLASDHIALSAWYHIDRVRLQDRPS